MADDVTSLDDVKYDPSKRAEAVLDHILKGDDGSASTAATDGGQVLVSEALAAAPVLAGDTGRTKARVLFITTSEAVLVQNSGERQYYTGLAAFFEEVHVVCLVPRQGKESVERAGPNTWVYQARAKHWWGLFGAGKRIVQESLTWAEGFRPDIVVGVDPFEAGLVAWSVSRRYKRPWQLHLYTNPYDPEYKKAAPDNNWRVRIASFLLRRTQSVRTSTGLVKDAVLKKLKRGTDITVLPRFYNFSGLLSAAPAFSLKERYPNFAFIILAFGPLTAASHLHDVFAAAHRLLNNPRIGMIVMGDGPAKELFENKVKLLGIERSVVFLKEADDLVSFFKTADALLELGTDEESEVRVLRAAASGLPVVAVETPLRTDLFRDGESALLSAPGDLLVLGQKMGKLINVTALRLHIAEAARLVAETRLHEDPDAHYRSIAGSITTVLSPASAPEER